MKFTRRDVIRTGAAPPPAPSAAGLLGSPGLRPGRAEIHAGGRRHAAPAALVALRAGRRGPVARQHQALHRGDRRRGARRQGKLGRHPPQGRRRRQCRLRPRPHAGLVRRPAPISRQAARRDRTRRLSRQQIWRLVRRPEGLCDARRQVRRPAAGHDRQRHRLSRQLGQGSRLLGVPEGHRQASWSSARRCRRPAIRPASPMATASATATTMRTGCCGAMAARWSTRAARSPSTAPRR